MWVPHQQVADPQPPARPEPPDPEADARTHPPPSWPGGGHVPFVTETCKVTATGRNSRRCLPGVPTAPSCPPAAFREVATAVRAAAARVSSQRTPVPAKPLSPRQCHWRTPRRGPIAPAGGPGRTAPHRDRAGGAGAARRSQAGAPALPRRVGGRCRGAAGGGEEATGLRSRPAPRPYLLLPLRSAPHCQPGRRSCSAPPSAARHGPAARDVSATGAGRGRGLRRRGRWEGEEEVAAAGKPGRGLPACAPRRRCLTGSPGVPPVPGRPAAAQGRAARPRGLALSQQSCCSGAGLGTLRARSWLVVVLVGFFPFSLVNALTQGTVFVLSVFQLTINP